MNTKNKMLDSAAIAGLFVAGGISTSYADHHEGDKTKKEKKYDKKDKKKKTKKEHKAKKEASEEASCGAKDEASCGAKDDEAGCGAACSGQ